MRGGREFEFLLEYLLYKCTEDERECDRFLSILAEYEGLGGEVLYFVSDQVCRATRLVPSSRSFESVRQSG